MITITPTLEIPPEIVEGLTSGIYERIGGVIRGVDGTKPIVTWLRDAPNPSVGQPHTFFNNLLKAPKPMSSNSFN